MILARLDSPIEAAAHIFVIWVTTDRLATDGVLRHRMRRCIWHKEALVVMSVVAPLREAVINHLEIHAVKVKNVRGRRQVNEQYLEDFDILWYSDDIRSVRAALTLSVK
jgi:hypothetical protein